jgi:hypothetical protein
MKITKTIFALLLITSMVITPTYAERSHKRPTMGGVFSGWYQQLRRAGGAKFHRELVDAGDNAGIAFMNRVEKAGNVIASGLSKSYTAACFATETGTHIVGNLAKGTLNAGLVIGKASINAFDAGMDSLAESSKTCVTPAWIEMKRTTKHIFVHGDMNTIPVDTLDKTFPGLSTKVVKKLRITDDTDICAAWKKVPATVLEVIDEYNPHDPLKKMSPQDYDTSHPHYATKIELADAFEEAFKTDSSVKRHIEEDCSTDFVMTC